LPIRRALAYTTGMLATETTTSDLFRFDNSYARLPDRFFARLAPTPVTSPRLIALNAPLALELGLDPARLQSAAGLAVLAGVRVPKGAAPLAMAYAGHQFGNFVPQLGDGRALLLGEVIDRQGRRRDIQLKGSGPTPFSRAGDGRAALGPVLREYIVSEAFAALGIPTTRALAAVATGDWVLREAALPGAILTRVAASHIRVGTFQYFAARGDEAAVRALADHAIARHDPAAAAQAHPYRAFFEGVMERQARLVARWLGVGFIHGVMNTDNMAVSGETIDFGPCAFLDVFDPAKVFSSIDQMGRYAYANQPRIAQWNLARLAETLLPLFDADRREALGWAQQAIDGFSARFEAAYLEVMRAKLGLLTAHEGDGALIDGLLAAMAAGEADFTRTFRALVTVADDPAAEVQVRAEFKSATGYDDWSVRWRARLAAETVAPSARAEAMRRANPALIPRNHRIEEAIAAAVTDGDFSFFERLRAVLARPCDDQPDAAAYAAAPAPAEVVRRTFCGT
jgi:uncharacterized protein YdiU (UPF0061 family)